jgi:hypothetical protein
VPRYEVLPQFLETIFASGEQLIVAWHRLIRAACGQSIENQEFITNVQKRKQTIKSYSVARCLSGILALGASVYDKRIRTVVVDDITTYIDHTMRGIDVSGTSECHGRRNQRRIVLNATSVGGRGRC